MSPTIIYVTIASFLAYQVDNISMKKYDMIDNDDNVVKVQFSKNNDYSCPLSCNLNHYHYAKDTSNNNQAKDDEWSIKYERCDNGVINYDINGNSINSYKVIKNIKSPKNVPKVNVVDISE